MKLDSHTLGHDRVRAALDKVALAMAQLEQQQATPAPRSRTKRSGDEPEPRQRSYSLVGLRRTWGQYTQALEAHMSLEERVLPTLAERIGSGRLRPSEARELMRMLAREHERMLQLSGAVHRATLGIDPLRGSTDRTLQFVREHMEWEETQLFNSIALDAGFVLDTPRAASSGEQGLTRELRSSLRSPEVQPVPERKAGFLARLVGWRNRAG